MNINFVKLTDYKYIYKEIAEIHDYETRNSIVMFKQIEKIVDVDEVSSINKANKEIETRHKRIVVPQAIFWTIVTAPTVFIPLLIWMDTPFVDEPPYCSCSTVLDSFVL